MISAIASYEGRRRVKGSAYLGIGITLFALLYAAFFPAVSQSGEALTQYIENLPPAVRAAFSLDAITTIEGFFATEFYQFLWLLVLGIYFAYRAGGAIAGDVESDRMDMILAGPVPRTSVVVGKFLSLFVPLILLNVIGALAVYASVLLAGETISITRLVLVHALSMPYFLTCAGIGLVLSVALSRADLAQRAAAAVIFAGFLLDTISTTDADLEWIGALSPTRHYDPTAILVHASYDWTGAGILLVAAAVLVAIAGLWFRRTDVL